MQELERLFETVAGCPPQQCRALASSGSNRRYYRLSADGRSLIGTVGTDHDENKAFLTISRHFHAKGLPVPEVLAVSEDGMRYLQEDLGGESLYDALAAGRRSGTYDEAEVALLHRTIAWLPRLQYEGGAGLDYSVCFPEAAFSARMVDFDLNYFKYCFLKESGVEFNEMRLQDDFETLREDLLSPFGETFMYRDFQARNVMLRDGQPFFIDFQGGRRGPVYYDVASFLWQARARYPQALREALLDTYLDALEAFQEVDRDAFRATLRRFVLFRTLQVLGAYGFRGLIERKAHFLESIPYALENLRELGAFPRYPYLSEVLGRLCAQKPQPDGDGRLVITVTSFSFKKGIPQDDPVHGGGYIFDCRGMNNPGRYARYAHSTGMDADVIEFLETDGEVFRFLESAERLVDAHAAHFLARGFTSLQVGFGCTGGHHRSVYCAEKMAAHLKETFPEAVVRIRHRELQIEK